MMPNDESPEPAKPHIQDSTPYPKKETETMFRVRPKEVERIVDNQLDKDNLIQILDLNGDSEPRKPTISASDTFSPKVVED